MIEFRFREPLAGFIPNDATPFALMASRMTVPTSTPLWFIQHLAAHLGMEVEILRVF